MSKFLRPLLFVLIAFTILSFFSNKQEQNSADDVVLITDASLPISKVITVQVKNNTEKAISIEDHCPKNPLKVEKYVNGQWMAKEAEVTKEDCPQQRLTIEPNQALPVNFGPWSAALFDQEGKYRLSLDLTLDGAKKSFTSEVEVTSQGVWRTIWEEVLYKPIFNTLIYFISILPSHSLGWAVILLTLVIKLILLIPNQKALQAQKKMQKVQPQLDALKKKYQNDPQRLAAETMEIWKKHKVSPMGSCLPILIQFPILIALFYVVRNGLGYINPHLLYSGLQGFDASLIETHFLGLDLTQVNIIVLPIVIGLLQFIQMKLSVGKALKNQPEGDTAANPMLMMNKTMVYFMPVMIAVFTASVPAAVGFYWGTSTLFGIAQQLVVNRSTE